MLIRAAETYAYENGVSVMAVNSAPNGKMIIASIKNRGLERKDTASANVCMEPKNIPGLRIDFRSRGFVFLRCFIGNRLPEILTAFERHAVPFGGYRSNRQLRHTNAAVRKPRIDQPALIKRLRHPADKQIAALRGAAQQRGRDAGPFRLNLTGQIKR